MIETESSTPLATARLIKFAGQLPIVERWLRWYAMRYRDGSVVTIKHGYAAGLLWRRSHRYVNGYWIGQYELPIQKALVTLLKAGDTFFDIGANAGFFTVLAARIVGPRGRCIAFEPVPLNHHDLEYQLRLNAFKHCHAVMEAVGDRAGIMSFSSGQHSSQGCLVEPSEAERTDQIRVCATTIDHAVTRFGKPDLIKLDIEGAEVKALAGARNTLNEHTPSWLIELHGPECETGVKEILKSAGYRFFDLSGKPLDSNISLPHHMIARHPNS